ncbi:hypothetical protein GCM10010430_16010 [Kitasatospora cystarginea]|uniref:Polysaccharide chain length determinant N-terminal domain-containing protein n=1 Tax=Kitasatospora cystarginea TaxID=58350 RepID=A0ABP5QIH6_9ACTN
MVRALLRRWYVLALAAVLTLAGAVVVAKPPVVYRSAAVVRIKPPETPQDPSGMTDFRPSLAIIGAAVVTVLKSPSGTGELRQAGVSGDFDLAPRNTGTTKTEAYVVPTVEISVKGADPKRADLEVDVIVQYFGTELRRLQDGKNIPEQRYITSDQLVPATALPVLGVKSRGLVGVAALGMLGGVACTLWTDEYLRSRARRRTVLRAA